MSQNAHGKISTQKRLIFIGFIILLVISCSIGINSEPTQESRAGSSDATLVPETPAAPPPVETPEVTVDTGPTIPPPPDPQAQTWTVIDYHDADDPVLEYASFMDVNEMERAGSNDRVHIISLLDRYKEATDIDGDWTNSRVFDIQKDDDMLHIASPMIQDLGEVNMADEDTLVNYATWVIQNYPADKYVLILSDHGAGWPGGWSDKDPEGRGRDDISLADFGDNLFTMEITRAFDRIRAQTGLDKFEVIAMDACLMNDLAVGTQMAPYTRYFVASQESVPNPGLAYTGWLSHLVENPAIESADLAREIVASYIVEDQQIVDDQLRSVLLKAMGLDPNMSAADLAASYMIDSTMSAIDTSLLPDVNNALNNLVIAMTHIDQNMVAEARSFAQKYFSIFSEDFPAPYMDLVNFAELVAQKANSPEITAAVDALKAAVQKAVIAEKHGDKLPGSNGISIYFPNSGLFSQPYADYWTYTTVVPLFTEQSQWDEFMAFHFSGSAIQPTQSPEQPSATQEVLPTPSVSELMQMVAPGAAPIRMDPVKLSATSIPVSQTITISSTAYGKNISYIYIFIGYMEDANTLHIMDMDFIDAKSTLEVGGVNYPDWGSSGVVPITYDWKPHLFAFDVNGQPVITLFAPNTYGATPEQSTYTVLGNYRYKDSSDTLLASITFSYDGQMQKITGYSNPDGVGSPAEIVPNPGDTFTALDTYFDLSKPADDPNIVFTKDGATITFSDQPVTWLVIDPPTGNYVVGYIAENLDGDSFEQFANLKIQ